MSQWKREYDVLATYNSEVVRGVAHTPEYDQRMKLLQAEYDHDYLGIKNEEEKHE